jgi:ATP-binding cassette subfamily C protein CydC
MVTHQLEGIADWDQIWVMENGRIVEQGDYASRCRPGAICDPAGEPSGGYLMRALLPYLALYKRHKWMLTLGIVLAIVTLLASIGLLTLSGWFLSASAVAGFAGLYSFNYMLRPPGFAVPPSPVLPDAISNGWSATTPLSACCSTCVSIPSANCCPLPCRAGAFSSGRIA